MKVMVRVITRGRSRGDREDSLRRGKTMNGEEVGLRMELGGKGSELVTRACEVDETARCEVKEGHILIRSGSY